MRDDMDRRGFLKGSAASAGLALGLSQEDRILLANLPDGKKEDTAKTEPRKIPMAKFADLEVSRVICGGNLIGGWAHSRDLLYVSELLKNYFTDEKIFETLQICEENGINTVMTQGAAGGIALNKYWNQTGGSMQWMSQECPSEKDKFSELKRAIDEGACAVHVQGHVSDAWVRNGMVELLGETVEYVKSYGVAAGVAAHSLEAPMACEEAGIDVDYYMKTFHHQNYFSARREGQPHWVNDNTQDNYWCTRPEEVAEFFAKVEKPWLAYKVLAAGAISPQDGFKYAFENGADMIAVGMFDFQVKEDVDIALDVLSKVQRKRPWRA